MSEPLRPPPPPPPPPAVVPAPESEREVPTETGTESPPPLRVSDLGCPTCGGSLEVESGLRVVHCPFCETALLARGEVGVRRFAVPPKIDASRAREIVRRWLGKGWHKDPGLKREATLAEAFLCFLPFFRVRADVVGHAFGLEERTRTVGSGKNRRREKYQVPVERRVDRHFDRTFAAVNVAEWGVHKVDLSGDRLVAFDDEELRRQGMVFPPTGSEVEVRQAALDSFKQEADPAQGLKRTTFRFLETLRHRFTVVYYPLWVVRYRFQERSYQAVVDAEDGHLAYGKAPGNDLYRAACLVGSQAAAAFVASTALHWGFGGSVDGSPIGLLLVVVGLSLLLLRWGWKRFRYGAVVEEGSGRRSAAKKSKKPVSNNPLARWQAGSFFSGSLPSWKGR